MISPTVPPPVPHCSTTAVYNGSSNELTNIVVNWFKAEVSLECFIMNSGIPMCVHEYCGAIHVYVNINEPHLPENGRSSYKATLCSSTICACDLVNVWNLVTEHSMMKYTTLFDCGPLSPDIICVRSVHRPSPFFTVLLLPCITEEQKWGRPGNKPSPTLKVLYTYTCSW